MQDNKMFVKFYTKKHFKQKSESDIIEATYDQEAIQWQKEL